MDIMQVMYMGVEEKMDQGYLKIKCRKVEEKSNGGTAQALDKEEDERSMGEGNGLVLRFI